MSLAQLLAPPPTDRGLDEFAWAHFQHHLAIIQATKTIKKVILPEYQIYPMVMTDLNDFLRQHQQMHTDMESLYRVNGNDLTSVDFNNPKERDSWIFLNYISHRDIGAACGIPI